VGAVIGRLGSSELRAVTKSSLEGGRGTQEDGVCAGQVQSDEGCAEGDRDGDYCGWAVIKMVIGHEWQSGASA
jgi:hypothetical protein